MFTGIVEELGRVASIIPKGTGALLTVECSQILRDATLGASIAVNGACVTAVELGAERFSADLAPETLSRTNLGDLRFGSSVNLERPLRADGRLDGHFVLGHVDGVARILSLDPLGDENWWLKLDIPADLTRYIVEKGSVAVDGISLTVANVSASLISFAVIPHTYRNTSLRSYSPGAKVNIEVDILAKHLEKFARPLA